MSQLVVITSEELTKIIDERIALSKVKRAKPESQQAFDELEIKILEKVKGFRKGVAKSLLKSNSFRKISHDDYNKAVDCLLINKKILSIPRKSGYILKVGKG
jgi:hypothetical protein